MRRILRRILNMDPTGRLLSSREEQLSDDEQGTIEETTTSRLYACQACSRPLEGLEAIRGTCVVCRRSCCVTCLGACAVCHRPLCGDCRAGFAEKAASVCDTCLAGLQQRLERQDRMLDDKVAVDRLMGLYAAQMKLVELHLREQGSVWELIGKIAQLRLARKLSFMEWQIAEERRHGRRLLP